MKAKFNNKRNTNRKPSFSSWRDAPIIIATVSAASSFGLAVLLFTQLIIPYITNKETLELSQLKDDRQRLKFALKEIDELKVKLGDYESLVKLKDSEISKKKRELEVYEIGNLFDGNSPYPIKVDRVKIGDNVSKLYEVYPRDSIEDRGDGVFSVSDQHALFNYISYFYAENRLTHISFSSIGPHEVESETLRNKLTSAFGEPKTYKKPGFYSWSFPKHKARIFLWKYNSLIVMNHAYYPAYWPMQ